MDIDNPTYRGALQSGVSTVVPNDLKFPTIKTGLPTHRDICKLDPLQPNASGQFPIIRFDLPNVYLGDFRRSQLEFTVDIAVTGGTYKRLAQGAWSVFNRLRIIKGVELEDIRDYNLYESFKLNSQTETDVVDIIGSALWGYGSQLQRNAWGATQTRYSIPLSCAFFRNSLIPLSFLQEKLTIELYLENATRCIETDGTAPTFTISNLKLYYDRVRPDTNYSQLITQQLKAGGLMFGGWTMETYTNVINIGTTHTTITINHRSDSVAAFMTIMRRQVDLTTTTINDKMITWRKYGLQQFQLKMNGEFIPEEPIIVSGNATQAYSDYLKYLDKLSLDGVSSDPPRITGPAFNTDSFIIISDLRMHPGEKHIINPRGTAHATSTVYIDLQFDAPVADTIQTDTFVVYYTLFQIDRQGRISRKF